jgi:N-methylhydantoinase B
MEARLSLSAVEQAPIDKLDPITFSVILSRFDAIATEMTVTLEHTAWTSILGLARDYTCAIYDAVPRQIAMVDGVPGQTSMQLLLEQIAETAGGGIAAGDVFLCNHPFRGNTHIGDLATVCPVFAEGEHIFWACVRGHQQDVGAAFPSSMSWLAANVWQEGMHIPPIKLCDAGKYRDDIVELYLANVRYGNLLRGDLLAQLSSIERGKQRLCELMAELGVAEVKRYVDAVVEYADRRMAEEIRAIPDGVYRAETWLDSDGDQRENVPVKVAVTIEDELVKVDFAGSGGQSRTAINGTRATAPLAAAIPFLFYVSPDIPHNHGCNVHIQGEAPEGTICNARYPAATALATLHPSCAMIDAVNRAMVEALPERVTGGSTRGGTQPDFSGIDSRTGEAWGSILFNAGGGGGAAKGADGWPLFASATGMGCLKGLAIEQLELLYPLLVTQMEIEPESMGFGRWIGGPGIRFTLKPVGAPVELMTYADGFRNPPHGVLGGTPGIGGGQYIEDRETGRRVFSSGMSFLRIAEHESWTSVSTGGGGYGRPEERDAEQVRRDVRDGVIGSAIARNVFGVVLEDQEGAVAIEWTATKALRAELARVERPSVDPDEPGVGNWAAENMRSGDRYVTDPRGSPGANPPEVKPA